MKSERYTNKEDRTSLENPLAAVVMGLIYVNPRRSRRVTRPVKNCS